MPAHRQYRNPTSEFAGWAVWMVLGLAVRLAWRVRRAGRWTVQAWADLRGPDLVDGTRYVALGLALALLAWAVTLVVGW